MKSANCFVCGKPIGNTIQRVPIGECRPEVGFPLPESFAPLCARHMRELTKWGDMVDSEARRRNVVDTARAIEPGEGYVCPGRPGEVYFLQRSDTRIKIGFSMNVFARKRQLESAAGPLELLWTEPGGDLRESELHRQFSESRVHGEWFEPHDGVMAYVEDRLKQHA